MSGEKKHVVRFTARGWHCTCGLHGTFKSSAEQHAFERQGRIEMGRAS